MRDKTVRDIELDKILTDVKSHALSKEGADGITPGLFTTDQGIINERARRIEDIKERLASSRPESFPSLSPVLEYASSTHQDFPGVMTRLVGEFLSSYFSMLLFLEEPERIHPEDKILSDDILSSLDAEGEVVETHPRLVRLFSELEKRKRERSELSSAFLSRNRSIISQSEPLFRNNRVVIAVRSDAKLPPSCYVSGVSSSGATLLAEPREILESNNNVIIAEERIRAEKERIKHELSLRARELVPVLDRMLREVVAFDFHYSFAVWARSVKAERPGNGDRVRLLEARHPLLGAKAVPVSVHVPEGVSVVVFSGANAGGKTVTMKLIALLSALNQIAGIIPASPLSELPLYDEIYTDIGDGQSILEDVSTFSSHMGNIARICRDAGDRSLVVLDELGSGTDPEEGAALSKAILEYFSKRAALTCITSHYSTVKSLAYSSETMMNASMEFDERSGLPTYRVLEGIPGDSHAIATAKRMGMPREITEQADTALKGGTSSASVINSLLKKERAMDRKVSQAESLRREAEARARELEVKASELEKREDELRREGIREINNYLSSSRKELETLIADIRTGKLTAEKTRKAKGFMESVEKRSKEESGKLLVEEKDETPFTIGDYVLCGEGRSPGVVQTVDGNNVRVILENGLRLSLKKSQVRHTEKPERPRKAVYSSSTKKAENTIDVRGLILSEALSRLDDQLEAAVMSGMSGFSVIHGYGDGILSRGIHNYLKKRREVEDYAFALPEDGGMGKTYVTLKRD